jgi:hypothetical protein
VGNSNGTVPPPARQLSVVGSVPVADHSQSIIFRARVPALTGSADIKLNTRLSLRAPLEKIPSRTGHFPDPPSLSRRSKNNLRPTVFVLKGNDLMTGYSPYGGTNYRANQSAPTKLLCSVAIEYRELQNLRERVRMAEAATRDASARSRKGGLFAH